jgi:hypothetical protein
MSAQRLSMQFVPAMQLELLDDGATSEFAAQVSAARIKYRAQRPTRDSGAGLAVNPVINMSR